MRRVSDMEWISVKDRLPKVNESILCYQTIYGRSVGVMDDLGQFRFNHPGDTLKPTHWMPLPEPPSK